MTERPVNLYWTDSPSTLSRMETRLGIVATTLFAIIGSSDSPTALALIAKSAIRPFARNCLLAIVVLALAFQIWFVISIWRSVRYSNLGFGPAMLATQPRWRGLPRMVATLMWLLHFIIAINYTLIMDRALATDAPVPPQFWYIRLMLQFIGAYSAFLYLMLLADTIWQSEKIGRAMWHGRFIFDIALLIFATLIRAN